MQEMILGDVIVVVSVYACFFVCDCVIVIVCEGDILFFCVCVYEFPAEVKSVIIIFSLPLEKKNSHPLFTRYTN